MVHGGAYETGSARRYGDYRQLVRKFVSKGIIVVTIQYRLGILGNSSLGILFTEAKSFRFRFHR